VIAIQAKERSSICCYELVSVWRHASRGGIPTQTSTSYLLHDTEASLPRALPWRLAILQGGGVGEISRRVASAGERNLRFSEISGSAL